MCDRVAGHADGAVIRPSKLETYALDLAIKPSPAVAWDFCAQMACLASQSEKVATEGSVSCSGLTNR